MATGSTERIESEKKPEQRKPAGTESPAASAPAPAAVPAVAPPQVTIDDSQAMAGYANFCRVTGTPEELIVDFGLNPQPFGTPTEPVQIKQRIVTNFFTAKRLLHALHLSISRHEAAFGVLETDVQKRVQPRP